MADLTSPVQRVSLDGHWYDSHEEARLANILFKHEIEYIPHKRLCQDRLWKCDFYLVKYDCWLEYDGLGNHRRRKKFHEEKIQYYIDNDYSFRIITNIDDIFNLLKEL